MKPTIVFAGCAIACLIFFIVNLNRTMNDDLPHVSRILAILSFLTMIVSAYFATTST